MSKREIIGIVKAIEGDGCRNICDELYVGDDNLYTLLENINGALVTLTIDVLNAENYVELNDGRFINKKTFSFIRELFDCGITSIGIDKDSCENWRTTVLVQRDNKRLKEIMDDLGHNGDGDIEDVDRFYLEGTYSSLTHGYYVPTDILNIKLQVGRR